MQDSSVIGTFLLIITGLTTYKGFSDSKYFEEYKFWVDKILVNKEYKRLLSSGFLHANWFHFGFNMIALLSFSLSLEQKFGYGIFILLYFVSMLGGSLLALFIHRNHGDYSAIGASGAISGIVFASIILYPESGISFILFPIEIKSWIFGLLFIVISIFGIKSQAGNIGHEAHLGGAITGALAVIALNPSVLQHNWWIVLLLLVPTILFLILIIRNPAVLVVKNYWGDGVQKVKDLKPKPPTKSEREDELNFLLDKIRTSGFKSLSNKERQRLKELKDRL